MKKISDFILERIFGGPIYYVDLVHILEQDPKMEKLEDKRWENEDGEYDFHNVDRDYKYDIFTRLSGGWTNMENRYLYGPDSKHSDGTTVMVSGVYSGKFSEIPIAIVHFGRNGMFDRIDIVGFKPNGEISRYIISNGNNIRELENIIKS